MRGTDGADIGSEDRYTRWQMNEDMPSRRNQKTNELLKDAEVRRWYERKIPRSYESARVRLSNLVNFCKVTFKKNINIFLIKTETISNGTSQLVNQIDLTAVSRQPTGSNQFESTIRVLPPPTAFSVLIPHSVIAIMIIAIRGKAFP